MARDASLREPEGTPALRRRQRRRFWSHAMLLAACVLLANELFGERGLTETLRARQAYAAAAASLAELQRENSGLRDQVRRLRDDPATIEAVARRELGLLRPGEIVVTIKDVQ